MLSLGLRCPVRDVYFRQLPATFISGRGEGSFARTSAIVASVTFYLIERGSLTALCDWVIILVEND
jgi:hypothetical protein